MGIAEDVTAPPPRPRGRRTKLDAPGGDARAQIVEAAASEFGQRGYEASSIRAIARRAAVDPALVHHYFATKADLFAEAIGAPIRPDLIVREVLGGPRERMGENLVRVLLANLEEPRNRERVLSLLHAALGHEFAASMLRGFLLREVLRRIAKEIAGEDAELRASLVASQLVGLMITRYGIRIEPIASASADSLVARVGPVVQWYLTGDSPVDRAVIAGE